MSRKLFAPLAVVVAMSLAACGGDAPATNAPAETPPPATTTPPADGAAPATPAPATP
jgi:predicted small lipoprotein YifL